MTKSHRTISMLLYGFIRGELSSADRQSVEAHVQSCKQCASELRSLREAMELLDRNIRKPSDHRSEMYWRHFAEKVERRIQADREDDTSPSIVERLLGLVVENRRPFGLGFASALSLIAVLFAVWSLWFKPSGSGENSAEGLSPSNPTSYAASVQRASLESRTGDYLEQSKVLLIGLVNADPKNLSESRLFLERQKQVSRLLVRQSEELTAELTDPSQRRLKELISDLGLILVQIANLEADHDAQGVEIVRSGVERNGILFKINLEEIQRMSKSSTSRQTEKNVKPTI